MLEFQQFNMMWDKKMADYEKHAEELVVSMRVSEPTPGRIRQHLGTPPRLTTSLRRVATNLSIGQSLRHR